MFIEGSVLYHEFVLKIKPHPSVILSLCVRLSSLTGAANGCKMATMKDGPTQSQNSQNLMCAFFITTDVFNPLFTPPFFKL